MNSVHWTHELFWLALKFTTWNDICVSAFWSKPIPFSLSLFLSTTLVVIIDIVHNLQLPSIPVCVIPNDYHEPTLSAAATQTEFALWHCQFIGSDRVLVLSLFWWSQVYRTWAHELAVSSGFLRAQTGVLTPRVWVVCSRHYHHHHRCSTTSNYGYC